jgi:hypothetical protein
MTSEPEHKRTWFSEKRDNCDYFPDVPKYFPYTLKAIENRVFLEYKHIDYMSDIFRQIPGQIQDTTELGIFMSELMANGPKKWVEFGTWNGNGTTRCVLKGMAARSDLTGVEFWSYEADPDMYVISKQNLESNPFYGKNFILVKGRLPCTDLFLKPQDIPASEKKLGNHYELFYEKEKLLYETCPQVAPPFDPQVAILDGGEFCSEMDWRGLSKKALEYVILDDINCFKNRSVYEELLANPIWKLVKENMTDRNGWAIFRTQPKFEGYTLSV